MSDGRVPRGQEAISPVRTGQDVTERSRKMIVHENLKESLWGLWAVPVGSGGRGLSGRASEGPENTELG